MVERMIWMLLVCCVAVGAVSCDTSGARQAQGASDDGGPELIDVKVRGETFRVELAIDNDARVKGLSEREGLPDHGGMLFAFPSAQQRYFVMRDCHFDIDIAFLDGSGRVLSLHAMKVEPRQEGESDLAYEQRLKRYPSFYAAEYALEVIGGTWERIGIAKGETVEFDRAGVKARVR